MHWDSKEVTNYLSTEVSKWAIFTQIIEFIQPHFSIDLIRLNVFKLSLFYKKKPFTFIKGFTIICISLVIKQGSSLHKGMHFLSNLGQDGFVLVVVNHSVDQIDDGLHFVFF